MQRTLRIILTTIMTKYRDIDFNKMKYCWDNNIYITPEPLKGDGLPARIDVWGYSENGMVEIKRKGNTIFSQRNQKEKELMYNNIVDAYEYYYDKLTKNEKR